MRTGASWPRRGHGSLPSQAVPRGRPGRRRKRGTHTCGLVRTSSSRRGALLPGRDDQRRVTAAVDRAVGRSQPVGSPLPSGTKDRDEQYECRNGRGQTQEPCFHPAPPTGHLVRFTLYGHSWVVSNGKGGPFNGAIPRMAVLFSADYGGFRSRGMKLAAVRRPLGTQAAKGRG